MAFGRPSSYVRILDQHPLQSVDVGVDSDRLLVDAPGSGEFILRRTQC
jgi:16S rRNA C967 or C1407 C5-methylase (RsmB/RsmF family)